jgi:hypothetical protein
MRDRNFAKARSSLSSFERTARQKLCALAPPLIVKGFTSRDSVRTGRDNEMSKNRHQKHQHQEHAAKIEPSPEENRRHGKEQTDSSRQLKIALILNWITGVAACVGLLGLIYLRGQLGAMIESNSINRTALESVQRAFVSRTGFDLRKTVIRTADREDLRLTVVANWQNGGATPALGVIHSLSIDELSSEPSGDTFIGNAATESPEFIGPKGPMAYKVDKPLSFFTGGVQPGFIAPMIKSNRKIFLWGWVLYRHIFPKTRPHLTEFCVHLVEAGTMIPRPTNKNIPALPDVDLTWEGCASHNCVDEDCPEYEKIKELAPKPN